METTRLDKFVINRRERIRQGDDEALDGAIRQLRGLSIELVQQATFQGTHGAPMEACVNEGLTALYEALMLWQPERELFVSCLDRRVRMRLSALFLRVRDLQRRALSIPTIQEAVEAIGND